MQCFTKCAQWCPFSLVKYSSTPPPPLITVVGYSPDGCYSILGRENICSSSAVSRRDLGHTQPPIHRATETRPREIQGRMRVVSFDFPLSSFVVVMRRNVPPVAPRFFILKCLTEHSSHFTITLPVASTKFQLPHDRNGQ